MDRNEYMRGWRAKNKEKYRAYMRDYMRQYIASPEGAARHRARAARYRRANPAKIKARNRLTQAIISGLVKRQPCEVCGQAKAEAHHHDYDRPLDVRWFCKVHHEEEHHESEIVQSAVPNDMHE